MEKEKEAAAFELWRGLYPHMVMGMVEHKSFTDFKADLFQPVVRRSNKTAEQIEAEMARVIALYEGGEQGGTV